MIDRRSMLLTGAALGATMVLPGIANATTSTVVPEFDVIDLAVWTGERHAPAPVLIEPGSFLRPHHLVRKPGSRSLTALLSPANALLLAEYLRFEPRLMLEEHAVSAKIDIALTHARIVTASWTSDRQL